MRGMQCLDSLEKTMKGIEGNTAGLFMEPIQGEGGYIVPPKEFVEGVRNLCNEYNITMVSDEIQSGVYRTGKFLGLDNYRVKADIVCLGKGIGGGIPIGVTLAGRKIMNWPSGSHANTFGGNLLSCSAGIAVLDYMKEKKLGENAVKVGKYFMERLNELKEKHEIIGDVRGKGLIIGIELVKDRKSKKPAEKERHAVLQKCFSKGLILIGCGKSSIRFCPPSYYKQGRSRKRNCVI